MYLNNFVKKIAAVITGTSLAMALAGCSSPIQLGSSGSVENGTITQSGTQVLMDTVCSYSLTFDADYAEDANADKVFGIGEMLETCMLARNAGASETTLINVGGVNEEGYELSEDFEKYIAACLELSESSEGAFDITLGMLTDLWNINEYVDDSENYTLPDSMFVAQYLEMCGYDKIEIANHKLLMHEKVYLDFGAVGKGIHLQKVYEGFKDSNLHGGVVTAGGSVLVMGEKLDGSDWYVGVVDPFNPGTFNTYLVLQGDWFVSTSGDYERYVMVDDVRYHHILDGSTGYPAQSGLRSVTVLMPAEYSEEFLTNNKHGITDSSLNGLLSDALSTAVFVMGEEKGMALAVEYGAEVFVVREDGTTNMTFGMNRYIKRY